MSVSLLYVAYKVLSQKFLHHSSTRFRHRKCSILITGCSTGIGEASASYFVQHSGYHVIGTFRKQSDIDRFVENHFKANKDDLQLFTPILLDVTNSETIRKCMPTIEKVHEQKPLFALVNNAGLQMSTIVENMDVDNHIRKGFDVNVLGVYRMVQTTLPLLRESKKRVGRARIIFVSSMAGMIALPTATAYSASKWAVQAISQGLRNELKRFGIETCSINPGSIRTNFRINAKSDLEKYLSSATDDMRQNLYKEYYDLWQRKYDNYFKNGAGYEEGKGIPVSRAVKLLEKTIETSHLEETYFLGKEGLLVTILSVFPQFVTDWALRKTYQI